jgi:LEA14-like dessication related protein
MNTRTGRTRRAAVLLAACALFSACAVTPKLETPHLAVTDVTILNNDLWAQKLRVRVQVDNPNNIALPVRGLEYTIEVEGQQFATGESAASFVVPARGQAEFDMNVTANLAGTLIRLLVRGQQGQQTIAYRLTGKLSLSAGFLRSIPFEDHGTFNLD